MSTPEINAYELCTAARRLYSEFVAQTGHARRLGSDEFMSVCAFYRWFNGLTEKPEAVYQSDWDTLSLGIDDNHLWIIIAFNWGLVSNRPGKLGSSHGPIQVKNDLTILYEDGPKIMSINSAVSLPESTEMELYVSSFTATYECLVPLMQMGSDGIYNTTRPTTKEGAAGLANHLLALTKQPDLPEHVRPEAESLAKRLIFTHTLQ